MSHSELQRTYKQARKSSNNTTKVRQFYNKLLEDYYSNLPKVKIEPKLEDYGLNVDIIAKNQKQQKYIDFAINVVTAMIYFLICFVISLQIDSENSDKMLLTFSLLIPLTPIGIILFHLKDKIHITTKTTKMIILYDTAKNAYNYYKEQKKKEYWLNMSGRDFEVALAKVFKDNGYKTELTQASADGGVDIIIYENEQPVFVQCKAYNKPVGVAVARELYGVMQDKNVEQGVIATLNGVTQGVYDFVNGKNIKLIDLVDILKMVED